MIEYTQNKQKSALREFFVARYIPILHYGESNPTCIMLADPIKEEEYTLLIKKLLNTREISIYLNLSYEQKRCQWCRGIDLCVWWLGLSFFLTFSFSG